MTLSYCHFSACWLIEVTRSRCSISETVNFLYSTSKYAGAMTDQYEHVLGVVLQASWTASSTPSTVIGCMPIRQWIVVTLATVTYKARIRLSGVQAYLQCEIHSLVWRSKHRHAQLQLFSFSNNQPLYHYIIRGFRGDALYKLMIDVDYIICSQSVLCSRSYSLELSWWPHPFSWYVFDI